MFSNVFYEWSREYNSSSPPALVPLSYPLPSKYIDQSTGLEHQLPPTYKARLNTAVPGLRVKVQYDLSAKIVRSRRKIPFITKTTRLVSHAHAHPPPHPFPLSYRSDPKNPPPFYLFPPHLFDRRFVSCPRIVDRLTFFYTYFWHRSRIHVPFIYRPRYQPVDRVSLPPSPRFRPGSSKSRPGSSKSRPGSAHSTKKGHSSNQAQKVFIYTCPSLHGECETEIKVRTRV